MASSKLVDRLLLLSLNEYSSKWASLANAS